jgi:hypothetical protein
MSSEEKERVPPHAVPKAEPVDRGPTLYVLTGAPGDIGSTLGLVTSISTTANATFDKLVGEFSKRISDKAADILVSTKDQKAP